MIPRIVALCIASLGVLSWACNFKWGVDWGGDVTMKVSTSICLAIVSANALLLDRLGSETYQKIWDYVALASTTVIFYVLSILLQRGGSSVGIAEPEDWATLSTRPGVPSVATMALLLALSMNQFLKTLHSLSSPAIDFHVRRASLVVGCIAILGHATDLPLLMFYVDDMSTAVAVPTALVFILLGWDRNK